MSPCYLSHQALKSGERANMYVSHIKMGINKNIGYIYHLFSHDPPHGRIFTKFCTAVEVVHMIMT